MDSYSDEFRHLCEVLYVRNIPTREARNDYLSGCLAKRGPVAVERLKRDVEAWWHRREELKQIIEDARRQTAAATEGKENTANECMA